MVVGPGRCATLESRPFGGRAGSGHGVQPHPRGMILRRTRLMAGTFELFVDDDSQIRFRLVMPDGHVLAVSDNTGTRRYHVLDQAAAAAIEEVRECAGTGLIQDVVPPRPGVV